MECIIFAVFLLSLFTGNVHGVDLKEAVADTGTSVGEDIRQGVVEAVDSKDGQQCLEATDNQCPRNEVTFWLYTRKSPNNPYQLDPSKVDSLSSAPFIHRAPLKILVHGYTNNKDTAINKVLRPAYLNDDYNIISVDWSALCLDHCYAQAADSVPTVGQCVADFLSKLLEIHRDVFTQVHLMGHSLGAHVTSWASQSPKMPRLDRITQFDPAFPLFSDQDSALYVLPVGGTVDVWHSNSGLLGRKGKSGTIDIFFNDGKDQPGCNCDTSCSHLRAVEYYNETVVNQRPLQAFRCDSYRDYENDKCPVPRREDLVEFGETASPSSTGVFLAFTNAKIPYIINGDAYTHEEKFRNFKNTHDEPCTANDLRAKLGDVIHL